MAFKETTKANARRVSAVSIAVDRDLDSRRHTLGIRFFMFATLGAALLMEARTWMF